MPTTYKQYLTKKERLSMRYIEYPRYALKFRKSHEKNRLKLMEEVSFVVDKKMDKEKLCELFNILIAYQESDDKYQLERDFKRRIFMALIVRIFYEVIANLLSWKNGGIVRREKYPDEDMYAVVSPDNEYIILGFVVGHSFKNRENFMLDLYERIISGNLPPAVPGKFLDLADFFYGYRGPEEPNMQCLWPLSYLEKDRQMLVNDTIVKSLCYFGIVSESERKRIVEVANDTGVITEIPEDLVIPIIQSIEKDIEESKKDAKMTPKNTHLAALGALYGQCWVVGCNYFWARSWRNESYKQLVVSDAQRRYYLNPTSMIKKALLSKQKPRLLELYTKAKENTLPPQEYPPLPDIIEY